MIGCNMKTIAITIDEDTLERIERLSARDGHPGRNRSRLIRDAVKDYVSRLERATDDEREAGIVRRHKSKLASQAAAAVKAQATR